MSSSSSKPTKISTSSSTNSSKIINQVGSHLGVPSGNGHHAGAGRGLRPNGTTFYQSENSLLLPPKFPEAFSKRKAPGVEEEGVSLQFSK